MPLLKFKCIGTGKPRRMDDGLTVQPRRTGRIGVASVRQSTTAGQLFRASISLKRIRRSAWSAATYQIHDCQQHDGTQQRDQQGADTEIVLVNGAGAEQWRKQPPAQQRADDAD